ncbi:MAG: M23 family metallopeptidase [Erythrobacter sp.]
MPAVKVLGAIGLFGLLACSGSEAAVPEVVSSTDNGQAVAAQSMANVVPASPQPPQPPERPHFTVDGELTQGGFIRGVAPSDAARVTLGEQTLEVAEDGSFFAAFDRDSPASLALTAVLPGGATQSETLSIAPREWQISHVNVAKRSGGSSEAWWKKRKPEYEAINAARAKKTDAKGWQQDFIWPVKGRISGRFGRQRIYKGEPGSYHSGIDIAPGNGVPFVAPADGVVVLARTGFSFEGGLIIIDHGAGLNSAFLHASRIAVEEGESVKQGQYIGNVGSTGRATGPHLHWSLKWNTARLDPLLFVGPMN